MYFVYYNVTTCTKISYSNMRMREALSVSLVLLCTREKGTVAVLQSKRVDFFFLKYTDLV